MKITSTNEKSLPFVRSPYNYDREAVSNETGLRCEDVSLAKQSFAEEVDINTIVRRFGLTGQLPDNPRMPQYGDFTGVFDFHSAMGAVRQAEENFMELPASIRARFHNDPQELLEFVADESNRPEAQKMGLVAIPASPEANKLNGGAIPPQPEASPKGGEEKKP